MLTPEILTRLNGDGNAPVMKLETPQGPAEFVKYKPGNFKDQNVFVKFGTGKTHWYPVKKLEVTNAEEINNYLNK